jgi:hypothetical protein
VGGAHNGDLWVAGCIGTGKEIGDDLCVCVLYVYYGHYTSMVCVLCVVYVFGMGCIWCMCCVCCVCVHMLCMYV